MTNGFPKRVVSKGVERGMAGQGHGGRAERQGEDGMLDEFADGMDLISTGDYSYGRKIMPMRRSRMTPLEMAPSRPAPFDFDGGFEGMDLDD